jgi:hypothetical protein
MALLTDTERERLKEEELLRKEIRSQLEEKKSTSKGADFFSQAGLLFIGFVLTTLAGSILTHIWKARESENQKSRIERQHAFELRHAIADRMLRTVADTDTAAEDVLRTYEWTNWKSSEIGESRKNWLSKSREWRVASQVVEEEIFINFGDPQISTNFAQIEEFRYRVGNTITNLLNNSFKQNEIESVVSRAKVVLSENRRLLKANGQLMSEEAKRELEKPLKVGWGF